MKYIAFIIIGFLAQVGFSQSAHTVIEAAETVDTALLIVGGNRVALQIGNVDQPDSRGINVNSNGTGLTALSLDNAIKGESIGGHGVLGLSHSTSSLHSGVRGTGLDAMGVHGTSNNSYGVQGQTNSSTPSIAGVKGFSTHTTGVFGQSSNSHGVHGVVGQVISSYPTIAGVKGFSTTTPGVFGQSVSSSGVYGLSTNGVGVRARSFNGVSATFRSDEFGKADIMFPAPLLTGTDVSGIISSDPDVSTSNLILRSNADITLVVNRDNSASTGSFQIIKSNGVNLMEVHETNGTEIRGSIEMKSVGSNDNGLITSDRDESSSDLVIEANDDIALQLDSNNDEAGELRVRSGGDVVIFRLRESGDLNITGSLNQGSDRHRKHSIKTIDENVILDQINTLPVYSWKYNGQDSITHVGPMAQDFYAQFGLGQGETTISSIDADGINLAGIKALIQENQKLKSEVVTLKNKVQMIEEMLSQINKK